ncbi:MAG: zinc-binding dehydrogenase [Planctomycetota bacterium]|nr:zinc-binding dehydrogenase [Planctomycetota bacterium]
MQAVQITQHGGPEVLQLADVQRPEPGPGEVLVRVLAVSVNHLDLWVRRGMPGFPVEFPRIPGCDGTGEVAALGAGVNDLSVGQQVLLEPGFTTSLDSDFVRLGQDNLAPDYGIRGEHCDGFAAEYVTLPARYCLPLPAGLDPITTAATPLTFLTAWGMLMERAVIRKGETVMILGAGSGVGCAAIQIARDEGCRVFTSASSPEGRALGLELGAEAAVDHTDPNWPKEIKALTGGKGTDVVVEHVGPATWSGSMRVLARLGRLVTCGGTTGPEVQLQLPHLFIKQQTVLGSTMGPRSALPLILARLSAGVYRPVIDRILPLAEARQAHQLLEDRAVRGKIILVP